MNIRSIRWRPIYERLIRPHWGVGLLFLALLVFAACQPSAPSAPAEAATATAAPPPTEAPAASQEMTATEGMTATEEMTPAEGITATEEMTSAGSMMGDAANGQYIATITGGCGCHFNSDLGGLAGGNKFEGPFGVVYSANITSDEETGIAHDSDETLIGLLRTGYEQEDNSEVFVLSPVMPYQRFSILSDQDAQDVVAYLRTLASIKNAVPERGLTEEPQPFTTDDPPPAEAPSEPVTRGEYLVKLADCGGCHTPKNEDGSPMADMMLAGAPVKDEMAANITPDEETGIGTWTEEEIAHFLQTGMAPSGKMVEGAMAQQIERRFSKLTEADAMTMAAYLKTIPAVHNEIEEKE